MGGWMGRWLRRAGLSLAVAAFAGGPSLAATAPNIVLILVDDAGYTDFGAYGSEIPTPHIDALAQRGVRFSNFRATPMCAPSRAMLMTGMDSHTAGVANLPETTPRAHADLPAYQGRLAPGVETVATRLKRLGYHTFMAGKWHLGHGPGDLPNAHGFDRSFAMDGTGADNWDGRSYFPLYKASVWYEDGKPVELPEDFYSSASLVDRMIDYLDARPQDGQPFFAYLPFLAIHIPVQAPEAFVQRHLGRYDGGWQALREQRRLGAIRTGLIAPDTPVGPPPRNVRDWRALSPEEQAAQARAMAVNAAMLEAMDHHLGRFIAHLRATGAYENTLFVVLSDNGPEAGDPLAEPVFRAWLQQRQGYDLAQQVPGGRGTYAAIGPGWASAAAGPLSLFKFYMGEGGVRVPLIMAGPGLPQGQTAQAFSLISDITPTLLQLAGAPPEALADLHGKSLLPLLRGERDHVYGPDEPVGLEAAGDGALYKGRYKLTRNAGPLGDPAWRLYDIVADPGETRDLAAEQPDRVAEMLADYEAYAQRVGAAPAPEGFSADRQVAANVARHIIADFRGALFAGLAVAVALILGAVLGLRGLDRKDKALGARVREGAARLGAGLLGAAFLLLALRIWAAPALVAGNLAIAPVGELGLASLRADLAGFFGVGGGFALWAAVKRQRQWLIPPLALLGVALSGRVLTLVLDGGGIRQIPPMVVEALALIILALAWRALAPQPAQAHD